MLKGEHCGMVDHLLEGENNGLVVDHLLGKLIFQVLKLNQMLQKSKLVVSILIFVFFFSFLRRRWEGAA